jgi:uncharacterized damage-inducible protein DinB
MITPAYLTELYAYTHWANEKYLAAAEALTPEDFTRPQGHSWGSVHGMLVHMLAAEWIWLRRLLGNSPTHMFDPQDFPSLASIRTRWSAVRAELAGFLNAQTAESLQQIVHYRNTAGKPFSLPVWQILVHLANHATHHRGELAAMYALMNTPHEQDDWLIYFLQQGGQG